MLNIFQYRNGLQILQVSSLALDEMGELQVLTSDGKIYYHNGTIASALITEAGGVTISNKNFVDNSTFIIDNVDATIRIGFNAAGTTGTTTTLTSSQTANRTITFPDATDTLVGKATADILTNKSIDGNTNTITNISLSAGITGTLAIANGGTGQTTQQAAINALTGSQSSGKYLRSDGVDATLSTLLASDLSGTVSISNGGTGQATKTAGFDALSPMTTAGDIIIGGTVGSGIRLPATTNGFVLTLSGGSPVWAVNAGGSAVQTIGVIDSQSKSANGLVITSTSLVAQTADASFPGMVSINSQTFAGIKTFSTSIKTPTINDNGTGLTIQPALNQNLTLNTTGAGRIIVNGAEGLDMGEQGSTPANPASGFSDLYFKTNHLLYSLDSTGTERLVGAGGGSGINFVALDTTFAPLKSDNFNAENSIGDWVTYNDGPVAVPTDMTGGSATSLTLSRTTTGGEVLDGSASFKIVKTATNAQGQGTSVVANVPPGYRGQRAGITLPFKILSGSLVSGDLKFYVYDITNSQIIAPYNNDVLVSQSLLTMYFDIPSTTAQIRIGFHFASTSATAVTFVYDDVVAGPFQVAFGPAMSDWNNDLTFTPGSGYGTTTLNDYRYRRVGDSMEVQLYFKAGTVAASTANITLPLGYLINSSKFPSTANVEIVGNWFRISQGANLKFYSGDGGGVVFYDGTNTNTVSLAIDAGSNILNAGNGNNFFASSDGVLIKFKIPILGWSTNVTSNNSQVFNISTIIANGTRVTSTPTQLGQYRTYTQVGSTNTGADNAPSGTPTSADGMRIFSVPFTSSGTSGQPNRWEIFVGKNKVVRFQPYSSTGRTGWINTDISIRNTAEQNGVGQSYDPTTGVFIIDTIEQNSTTTNNFVGEVLTTGGGASTFPTDCYFDLIVSENALSVQSSPNRSQVEVYAGNGFGASSVTVRRFSNILTNTGTAITYADSASLGATFTINENGLYSVSYSDAFTNSGNSHIGISRNSTGLSSSIDSLAPAQVIQVSTAFNTDNPNNVGAIIALNAGDIIRAQNDGTTPMSSGNFVKFIITKVNN